MYYLCFSRCAFWANESIMRHICAVINIYAEINYFILKWPQNILHSSGAGPGISTRDMRFILMETPSVLWSIFLLFFLFFFFCGRGLAWGNDWLTEWLFDWRWPGCVHCDWHGKWYSHYAQDMLLSRWLNRKRKWQQALCAAPLGAIWFCILHTHLLFIQPLRLP